MAKSFNDMSREHLKKTASRKIPKSPMESLVKNPMIHAIATSLPVKYKVMIGLALLLILTGAGTVLVQIYNLVNFIINL